MRTRHFLFLILFIALSIQAFSQEQMKMMHYNILMYGNPFACNEANNNTDVKDQNLQFLLAETQPDIFTVNELGSGIFGNRILDEVLNVSGVNHWSKAQPTNTSWDSGIVNMLYFNNNKYTLYEQDFRFQSPNGVSLTRVIDMYKMYENNSAISGDTVFFNVIVCHLHSSDQDMRREMCRAIMDLVEFTGTGNYILSGDFNIDSSNEEAFQELIDNNFSQYNFVDPADALGSWHNNSNFAHLHSQSTHSSGGCFAGGGLDDRFDITLISNEVSMGTEGLTYINGSYDVYGNDGNNYNTALHINNNEAVSPEIASALYAISDHLPIITEYTFDYAVGLQDFEDNRVDYTVSIQDSELLLQTDLSANLYIEIFDLSGRRLIYKESNQKLTRIDVSLLSPSAYMIAVINEDTRVKKALKFIKL